jgi:thymidine kinase
MKDPRFTIFTGPMFGSKTTHLLAMVERYLYQKQHIVAFKPVMDNRYSDIKICTHSGGSLPAIGVKNGQDVIRHIEQNVDMHQGADVIAVDEAFMIDGIASALIKLFKSGKTIVVSSLQLSATGKVFEEIRDMMPYATNIKICPAVCPITGRDAYYTHKKIENLNEIAVGGAELYEPRCWTYHSYMNQGD